MGMAELERSRVEAETELDQLRAQKAFITNEVIALKENLTKVHYHASISNCVLKYQRQTSIWQFVTCELNSASPCLPGYFRTKIKAKQGQTKYCQTLLTYKAWLISEILNQYVRTELNQTC